jgi:hypothetical protein
MPHINVFVLSWLVQPRKTLLRISEKRGFKISYEYWSHAHRRNVFVMIREVSKKEWKTLVPEFPKHLVKRKK